MLYNGCICRNCIVLDEKWKIHGLTVMKNYYHSIAIFLNSTIFLISQILFSFSREKVMA